MIGSLPFAYLLSIGHQTILHSKQNSDSRPRQVDSRRSDAPLSFEEVSHSHCLFRNTFHNSFCVRSICSLSKSNKLNFVRAHSAPKVGEASVLLPLPQHVLGSDSCLLLCHCPVLDSLFTLSDLAVERSDVSSCIDVGIVSLHEFINSHWPVFFQEIVRNELSLHLRPCCQNYQITSLFLFYFSSELIVEHPDDFFDSALFGHKSLDSVSRLDVDAFLPLQTHQLFTYFNSKHLLQRPLLAFENGNNFVFVFHCNGGCDLLAYERSADYHNVASSCNLALDVYVIFAASQSYYVWVFLKELWVKHSGARSACNAKFIEVYYVSRCQNKISWMLANLLYFGALSDFDAILVVELLVPKRTFYWVEH